MNRENAEKLAAYLETLPEEKFDMRTWCGTACCIAGHATILSGKPADPNNAAKTARKWLGITERQEDELFLVGEAWEGIVESGTPYIDIKPQEAARAVRAALELWGQQ